MVGLECKLETKAVEAVMDRNSTSLLPWLVFGVIIVFLAMYLHDPAKFASEGWQGLRTRAVKVVPVHVAPLPHQP